MMNEISGKETPGQEDRARNIVGWYTGVAAATGGIPIPASSVAIVANNGFMISHISAIYSKDISWETVGASLGVAGTLNLAGRTVFIEAAKALSWGTGNLWALAALSAVGAATAGLQTYVVGLIAMEIAKKGGAALTTAQVDQMMTKAKKTYKSFNKEMKNKNLDDPGEPELV